MHAVGKIMALKNRRDLIDVEDTDLKWNWSLFKKNKYCIVKKRKKRLSGIIFYVVTYKGAS